MAIQPVSSVDYASRTLVSFGEKHKKGKKSDGGGHQTSASKAIPIVVLMAMSPLTQSAAAENYNKIASSPTTEVVVQNPQEPELPCLWVNYHGNSIRLWGISKDDNPNDAEGYLFKYQKELGNNKVAILAGQFIAVSETPREDGRYLMLYKKLDENEQFSTNYEIVCVPNYMRRPLHQASSENKYNHNACVRLTMEDFVKGFGEDAVKNAPNIEDATTMIMDK